MAYNFPNSPSNGDTVTISGIVYTYNSTSGAWKTTASAGGGGGGGASVTSSDTAPTSPSAGDLWWSSSEAVLYIYYADADSSQWVQATTPGADGASGLNVTTSDTAPTSPSAGDFWWNSTSNKLYIYYTDANSSQWVQATTPGADGAAGADGADGADDAHHENDENANGNTPDDVGAGKLSTLSLPRLDVNAEREANGVKYPKLLSPTEQGIRDSLKLERTRRLSSASKFNAGSTTGGSGASHE